MLDLGQEISGIDSSVGTHNTEIKNFISGEPFAEIQDKSIEWKEVETSVAPEDIEATAADNGKILKVTNGVPG